MNNSVQKAKSQIQQNRKNIRSSLKIHLKTQFYQSYQKHHTESTHLENINHFHQKYQQLEKLGQGGHAIVKKCMKINSGQIYAVKIFFKLDQQILLNIEKSYKLIKNLSHQSIIQVHQLYIQNQNCYLVMEYCSFPTLNDFIHLSNADQQVNLNYKKCKIIVLKILEAIQYLHKKGICHRDLKPQNILYDKENNKIKIIDFGISKKFKNYRESMNMWSGNGTLLYQAPEIINGCIFNQKVDIWAIGLIAYQLLMKKNPFFHQKVSQVIQNIISKQINFNPILEKYSESSVKFLNKALHKYPSQRGSLIDLKNSIWLLSCSLIKTSSRLKLKKKNSNVIRFLENDSNDSKRDKSFEALDENDVLIEVPNMIQMRMGIIKRNKAKSQKLLKIKINNQFQQKPK